MVFIVIFIFFQFHIRPAPYLDYLSPIPHALSSNPSDFTLVFDYALVDSNMSEFLHYYSCALCNMATFHAIGHSNLTMMVDDSRMTIVFEHCLCAMFVFQLGSLHISKDVSYDFNNFVSSSLCQILRTSS